MGCSPSRSGPIAVRGFDQSYNIILIGDHGVGKTALYRRLLKKPLPQMPIPTLFEDCKGVKVKVQDKRIKLMIYDTAGNELHNAIPRNYYKKANGVVVVYDVTKAESFRNIDDWLKRVEDNCCKDFKWVLVGNKSDANDSRVISTEQGNKFAQEKNTGLFETSALNNENLQDILTTLTEKILNSGQHQELEGQESIRLR